MECSASPSHLDIRLVCEKRGADFIMEWHRKCVNAINSLLRESALHSFTPLTLTSPYTTIIYTPTPPSGLTLLSLRTSIAALGPFSIYPIRASETLDALARSAQAKEATALAIRVFVTFLFAIPTFVIAIVGMSILTESNAFRQYLEQKVIGSADRGTVILFALATPGACFIILDVTLRARES